MGVGGRGATLVQYPTHNTHCVMSCIILYQLEDIPTSTQFVRSSPQHCVLLEVSSLGKVPKFE